MIFIVKTHQSVSTRAIWSRLWVLIGWRAEFSRPAPSVKWLFFGGCLCVFFFSSLELSVSRCRSVSSFWYQYVNVFFTISPLSLYEHIFVSCFFGGHFANKSSKMFCCVLNGGAKKTKTKKKLQRNNKKTQNKSRPQREWNFKLS